MSLEHTGTTPQGHPSPPHTTVSQTDAVHQLPPGERIFSQPPTDGHVAEIQPPRRIQTVEVEVEVEPRGEEEEGEEGRREGGREREIPTPGEGEKEEEEEEEEEEGEEGEREREGKGGREEGQTEKEGGGLAKEVSFSDHREREVSGCIVTRA